MKILHLPELNPKNYDKTGSTQENQRKRVTRCEMLMTNTASITYG